MDTGSRQVSDRQRHEKARHHVVGGCRGDGFNRLHFAEMRFEFGDYVGIDAYLSSRLIGQTNKRTYLHAEPPPAYLGCFQRFGLCVPPAAR